MCDPRADVDAVGQRANGVRRVWVVLSSGRPHFTGDIRVQFTDGVDLPRSAESEGRHIEMWSMAAVVLAEF